MTGYHVTTLNKMARYRATGAILPPVRFWKSENGARAWMRKTGRTVLLAITCRKAYSYPLPDHGPWLCYWTPDMIRYYKDITTP